MAKAPDISKTSLGYWRHTSTWITKDGKRTQKVFSLGKDYTSAVRQAVEIDYRWNLETTVDDAGKKVWSANGLTALTEWLKTPIRDSRAPELLSTTTQKPKPFPTPTSDLTLYAAFEMFFTKTGEWVKNGNCGDRYAPNLSVGYADSAGVAGSADYAGSAGSATTADNASYAGSAESANTTTNTFNSFFSTGVGDLGYGNLPVGDVYASKVTGTSLNLSNLPTSADGLATGDVWNDGGTLKIA
jgi:hypothetical protein